MLYRCVLLVHLLSVVVFFGNIVIGMVWKRRADRNGDPQLIAHAFATLQYSDAVITPIAVVTILASGLAAAWIVKLPILATGWILWALLAFAASGLLFVLRVLPLQKRLASWTSRTAAFERSAYRVRSRAWAAWAYLSLATATAALVIMFFRPSLPGLSL